MNVYKKFYVHTEELSVTTYRSIITLELQFNRSKHDINKLFDWHLLSNWNIFNNCFPDHTILYVPGTYQGWIFLCRRLKILKAIGIFQQRSSRIGNYTKHANVGSKHSCDATSYTITLTITINIRFTTL